MAWTEIASASLANGDVLTLRRNDRDYEIRIGLYELMSSKNPVSERAMAKAAAARLGRPAGHVLIGGLGMAYTVRAVLDTCDRAFVTVAELNRVVIDWNRGPLADLAGRPLDDPRVQIFEGDVAAALAPAAYDLILLDVDNGPEAVLFDGNGALYAPQGLRRLMTSLTPGGVLAVWAADPSPAFEAAARDYGLERQDVTVPGAVVHTIYLLGKTGAP